jgi:hypothetical protein
MLQTLGDEYDVLFLQEPPRVIVRQTMSSSSMEGDDVIGLPIHPDWVCMENPVIGDLVPHVLTYVHKRLSKFRPSL